MIQAITRKKSLILRSSRHICDELSIIVPVHNGDDVLSCILLDGEALDFLHFPSSFHFSKSIIRVGLSKIRIKRIEEIKKRFSLTVSSKYRIQRMISRYSPQKTDCFKKTELREKEERSILQIIISLYNYGSVSPYFF